MILRVLILLFGIAILYYWINGEKSEKRPEDKVRKEPGKSPNEGIPKEKKPSNLDNEGEYIDYEDLK